MSFQDYHLIWLSVHPERTPQWLQERLSEGFDIHHMDGDHSNNDPMNLCLIEHLDHMRLHNMPLGHRLPSKESRTTFHVNYGERCYQLRLSWIPWREIDRIVFDRDIGRYGTPRSMVCAKEWATAQEMPWPIDVPSDVSRKNRLNGSNDAFVRRMRDRQSPQIP